MSIQDKIAASQIRYRRKLRDYSVFINGIETKVIRLKVTINKYEDETDINVISHGVVTLALDIPEDIPMDRLRTSVLEPTVQTESTFLYDILPIVGIARFEDNIEKGDILILKIYDETVNDPLLWILRVSELLAVIDNRYLVSRTFQCSPHNLALPTEVQNIVDMYEEEG